MNNKPTDDISRVDDLSENNQEHAENAEIKLLDVVALTEDQPEHNLKRGEVGTVVEILSDGEAFEVEFSDDNGQMYKCSSFLASQITLLKNNTVKKNPAAQRLIKAMEKPPHLTDEDIEALNQSIKEGKIPIKFDSPFDSNDSEN